MQKVAVIAAMALLIPACGAWGQGAKLPVFTLRYSGGVGAEELAEDDAGLEPASLRQTVSLRIKEELSRSLVGNLSFAFSSKDYYDEPGDYTYFYLKPEISCELTDRLSLETALRSKWVRYDDPDSSGDAKDLLQLSGAVATSYEPVRGTRVTASLGTGFDVYDNEAKSQQSYSAGVRVLSRLPGVTVGGNYRGIFHSPMGAASEKARSLTSEFGLSLTWDPNKGPGQR